MMSLSLIFAIVFGIALLAGGGMVTGGAALLLKNHRVVGLVLVGLGALVILCPAAFGVYLIISIQQM